MKTNTVPGYSIQGELNQALSRRADIDQFIDCVKTVKTTHSLILYSGLVSFILLDQ